LIWIKEEPDAGMHGSPVRRGMMKLDEAVLRRKRRVLIQSA